MGYKEENSRYQEHAGTCAYIYRNTNHIILPNFGTEATLVTPSLLKKGHKDLGSLRDF